MTTHDVPRPTQGRLLPGDDLPLDARATAIALEFSAERRYNLGFPGATDLTYPDLAAILTGQLLNNIGDPYEPGHGRNHTKDYETDLIAHLGRLFHAGDRAWGYVTTGATEGTVHALDEASTAYRDLVVYTSTAAHYSITKACRLLKLPLVLIRTDPAGRMLLDDLRGQLGLRRHQPAAIVATAGTTMSEAVDDVAGIAGLCDDLGITRRRVHVDAAMAGIPLALLPAGDRPGFDFAAGATSVVFSGHKFPSTLMPCAVLLYLYPPASSTGEFVAYVGSSDTTITGSRSGHTPLLLWWSWTSQGLDGHRHRADTSRALADYTHDRLQSIGWPSRHLPHTFTVTLAQPATALSHPWVLGGDQRTGHIICMPGVEQDWIDELITDLKAHRRNGRIPRPRPGDPAGLDRIGRRP
jgi:histidine decarboxylase